MLSCEGVRQISRPWLRGESQVSMTHLVSQLEGEAGQQEHQRGGQACFGERLAHAAARALRKGEVALCAPAVTCTGKWPLSAPGEDPAGAESTGQP